MCGGGGGGGGLEVEQGKGDVEGTGPEMVW